MLRIILIYGAITGVVLATAFTLTMALGTHGGSYGMVVGYLTMLVSLSIVFVGVRRYRDVELGGVIRFWPAFGTGLAIAGIASLFFVIGWEIYMFATDYTFMDVYLAQAVAEKQAAGTPAVDIAKFRSDMEAFKAQYANPIFRVLITFSEIAPVGILVALASAAILRNSRAFPAIAARG